VTGEIDEHSVVANEQPGALDGIPDISRLEGLSARTVWRGYVTGSAYSRPGLRRS
jgi:hypothetical protein